MSEACLERSYVAKRPEVEWFLFFDQTTKNHSTLIYILWTNCQWERKPDEIQRGADTISRVHLFRISTTYVQYSTICKHISIYWPLIGWCKQSNNKNNNNHQKVNFINKGVTLVMLVTNTKYISLSFVWSSITFKVGRILKPIYIYSIHISRSKNCKYKV